MTNKLWDVYVLLGGNINRAKTLEMRKDQIDIFIVGLQEEVKELESKITTKKGLLCRGTKSFDTLTNFSTDIKSILKKFSLESDELIEMKIPTSPGHFYRCTKVIKMLQFFYPEFRKVRLIHIEYGETNDPIEKWLRPFYWTWIGILTFCFIAYTKRKILSKN